jgi:hypothetical protein
MRSTAADPFQVEMKMMTTPTAGRVICITREFLRDDVDVDIEMWSLCAGGVRRYSCAAEMVIKKKAVFFAQMLDLIKDSRGMRLFSCWYYEA